MYYQHLSIEEETEGSQGHLTDLEMRKLQNVLAGKYGQPM
jgi:hypothetical protein